MSKIINYGMSKKYLSHWGIKEALREIMQNFMDYGEYNIEYIDTQICISNNFIPEDLQFLAIGNSEKKNGSRGKYGEGLKMAMLVFAREGLDISIQTKNNIISPLFTDSPIGETFSISVTESISEDKFKLFFEISLDDWNDYYNTVIKEEDIIFDDGYYGRIVDKEKGNLYCGGLFVKKIDNLSKAYDINVEHLPLTRDRSLPVTLDINWASSKINEKQGKLKITDLTHSDTQYVDSVPEEVKKKIKPVLVGNSIEAVYKHKGKDIVIKNEYVRDKILSDNFFTKAVKKLRNYLLNKVGVYDMLVQFRDKHIHGYQATEEFNLILKKLKK